MELPAVWQLGTGDTARPYAPVLFELALAAIGPSSGGRWPRPDYPFHPTVRWFAQDAQPGDLVIAKRGLSVALGIGVLGTYDFSKDIDIEGWNLAHFRRTRWLATEPHAFGRQVFTQARFCGCDPDGPAVAWARDKLADLDLRPPVESELPPLPDPGPPLNVAALDHAVADV